MTFLSELVTRRLSDIKISAKIKNFFNILHQVDQKNIGVFGGAIRDWYLCRKPKDIDIVLDCQPEILNRLASNFKYIKTQFDGYQFEVDDLKFDIWRLQDAWFFQKGHADISWLNLVHSAPFNIDTVLVRLDGQTYDLGFSTAIFRREIELNNPINKDPKLYIVQRALRFKEKYGFSLGPKLVKFIQNSEVKLDKFTNINERISTSSN